MEYQNRCAAVHVLCVLFCREVHHSGLGQEGDSVPRLRGETGGTEEDPGRCPATETCLHGQTKICQGLLKMNEKRCE